MITVDARPSDSIAVALRTKATIFAEDSLLEQVSVEVSEDESVTLDMEADGSLDIRANAENLKDYLRKLNPEDFGRFTP